VLDQAKPIKNLPVKAIHPVYESSSLTQKSEIFSVEHKQDKVTEKDPLVKYYLE